jgi:poly(3-hydroxyalkanoate) synthetase
VGYKLVNLKSIGCPLLNVVAEFDAIVYPRSSLPLIDFVAGEDKSNLKFPTGHLGIAVSSEAHAKLWHEIASWLKKNGLPSHSRFLVASRQSSASSFSARDRAGQNWPVASPRERSR